MGLAKAKKQLLEGQVKELGRDALHAGVRGTSAVLDEAIRLTSQGAFLTSHLIDGGVLPALESLSTVRQDVTDALLTTVAGKKSLRASAAELVERVGTAHRYERLVCTLGQALWGSARYEGEEVLASDDLFTLSYLPPKKGVPPAPTALFHAGGFIPYGDRLFRFLPEASFFERFLERGVPVYALELKGTKDELGNLRRVTVDHLIDALDAMSARAFEHHGGRKLVIEGYCGTALPMLAFLAARPEVADARFSAALALTAPVDARKCNLLSDGMQLAPRSTKAAGLALNNLLWGYVEGFNLWASLDTSLKNLFPKTYLGRFAAGWRMRDYEKVRCVADLSPRQRFDLAANYWISYQNARRYPIPLALARLFSDLFARGVGDDGVLPCTYRGAPLSLRTVREKTGLHVVGIYGGNDTVVPEGSGRVLEKVLGERYTHVVHPFAGHVSYIMAPFLWQKGVPRGLDPNPVDLLLEAHTRASATPPPPAPTPAT